MKMIKQINRLKTLIEEKCRGEVKVDIIQDEHLVIISVTRCGMVFKDTVPVDELYDNIEKIANNFVNIYIGYVMTKFFKANIEFELDGSRVQSTRINVACVQK